MVVWETDVYHRWRGTQWSSSALRNVCCTGRCSSPRPGSPQAGWWADCWTGRHWAKPFPDMAALSWGRSALQRRPPLRRHPLQKCVSTRSAPPSQANRRSRRGRPSCRSLLFYCCQHWCALGVKWTHRPAQEWWMRRKEKVNNRETEGEKQGNANIQKYEAPKQKPVTGICSSCFWLVEWAPPSPSAPQLFINMTGWASPDSSTCVQRLDGA